MSSCKAYEQQRVNLLPTSKARKTLPEKKTTMLLFKQGNQVLLEKRADLGIWGGLWCFPEIDTQVVLETVALERFSLSVQSQQTLPILTHVFTHFKLLITPQLLEVHKTATQVQAAGLRWLAIDDAIGAAIPVPVRKLLHSIQTQHC